MDIILLVRRSRSYYIDEKCDQYFIDRYPRLKRNIMAWNFFFNIPYIEVRKRLSYISFLSYSRNSFDKIYFWGDYEDIKDDTIVVPIDEDDWVSKDLVKTLRSIDIKDDNVIKWNVINIGSQGIICQEYRNLFRSCCYAVRTPFDNKLIQTNVFMSRYKGKVLKIPDIMAVKIDNISSMSCLYNDPFEDILKICRERHVIKKEDIAEEYHDMIDMYNDLLIEIYDSCKIAL